MTFLKPYQKFVAMAVVVSFFTSLLTPLPPAHAQSLPLQIEGGSAPFLPVGIPPELGSIEEVFFPGSKTGTLPLIHIQSVHAHPETQRKIYGLLKFLDEKYGIDSLFIEGAGEELDPAYFRFFDDNRLNLRVAEKLVEKGELTGAELFLIESDRKIPAYGLENPSLYRENLTSFQAVMSRRDLVAPFTQNLHAALDRLETLLLNPEARRLLRSSESFDAGQLGVLSYVRELERKIKSLLGLDLRHFESQLDWPQLIRILRLQELESQLDPEKIQTEREKLIADLKTWGVETPLIEAFQNLAFSPFQSGMVYDPGFRKNDLPRYLAERLIAATPEKRFVFEAYPHFTRFLEASILQSELESERLFGEMERLYEKLTRSVSRNENEWKLVGYVHQERLLERLFDLELTPKDYSKIETFDQDKRPLVRFLLGIEALQESESPPHPSLSPSRGEGGGEGRKLIPDNIQKLEWVYGQATQFYRLAKEREEGMVQKILDPSLRAGSSAVIVSPAKRDEAISDSQIASSPSAPRNDDASRSTPNAVRSTGVSVLITGGFHADGLARAFRKKEVPYAILSPRITEKASPEAYISSLLGEKKTAFDVQYLEGVIGSQSRAEIRAQLPSDQADRLFEARQRGELEKVIGVVWEEKIPVGRFVPQYERRRSGLRDPSRWPLLEWDPIKNRITPKGVGGKRLRNLYDLDFDIKVSQVKIVKEIDVPMPFAEVWKEGISGESGESASLAVQKGRQQQPSIRLRQGQVQRGGEETLASMPRLLSSGERPTIPPQILPQGAKIPQVVSLRDKRQRTPWPETKRIEASRSPLKFALPLAGETAQTWFKTSPFGLTTLSSSLIKVNENLSYYNTPRARPEQSRRAEVRVEGLSSLLQRLKEIKVAEIQNGNLLGAIEAVFEEAWDKTPPEYPEPRSLKWYLAKMNSGQPIILPQDLSPPFQTQFGLIDLSGLNQINHYQGYDAHAQLARDLHLAHLLGLIRIQSFKGTVSPRRTYPLLKAKGMNVKSIKTSWPDWALLKAHLEKAIKDPAWVQANKGDGKQIDYYRAVFGEKARKMHAGKLYSAIASLLPEGLEWHTMLLNLGDAIKLREDFQEKVKDPAWVQANKGDGKQIDYYRAVFGEKARKMHAGNLYSAIASLLNQPYTINRETWTLKEWLQWKWLNHPVSRAEVRMSKSENPLDTQTIQEFLDERIDDWVALYVGSYIPQPKTEFQREWIYETIKERRGWIVGRISEVQPSRSGRSKQPKLKVRFAEVDPSRSARALIDKLSSSDWSLTLTKKSKNVASFEVYHLEETGGLSSPGTGLPAIPTYKPIIVQLSVPDKDQGKIKVRKLIEDNRNLIQSKGVANPSGLVSVSGEFKDERDNRIVQVSMGSSPKGYLTGRPPRTASKEHRLFDYTVHSSEVEVEYIAPPRRAEVRTEEAEDYKPPAAAPKTVGTVLEILRLLSEGQLEPGPQTGKKVRQWIQDFVRLNPGEINPEQAEAVGLALLTLSMQREPSERSKFYQEAVSHLNQPGPFLRMYLIRYWAQFFARYLNQLKEKAYRTQSAAQDQDQLLWFADAIDPELTAVIDGLIQTGSIWPVTNWDRASWKGKALGLTLFIALSPFIFTAVLLKSFWELIKRKPPQAEPEAENAGQAINRFLVPHGSFLVLGPRQLPTHFEPVLFEIGDASHLRSITVQGKRGWELLGIKKQRQKDWERLSVHGGFHIPGYNMVVTDLGELRLGSNKLVVGLYPKPLPGMEPSLQAEGRLAFEKSLSTGLRIKGILDQFEQADVDRVDDFLSKLWHKAYDPYLRSSPNEAIDQIMAAHMETLLYHERYHLLSELPGLRSHYQPSDEELGAALFELVAQPRLHPSEFYRQIIDSVLRLTIADETQRKSLYELGYEEIGRVSSEILDALIPGEPSISAQKNPADRIHALAEKLSPLNLDAFLTKLTPSEIRERAAALMRKRFPEVSNLLAMAGEISVTQTLQQLFVSLKNSPPYAVAPVRPSHPRAEVRKKELAAEDQELVDLFKQLGIPSVSHTPTHEGAFFWIRDELPKEKGEKFQLIVYDAHDDADQGTETRLMEGNWIRALIPDFLEYKDPKDLPYTDPYYMPKAEDYYWIYPEWLRDFPLQTIGGERLRIEKFLQLIDSVRKKQRPVLISIDYDYFASISPSHKPESEGEVKRKVGEILRIIFDQDLDVRGVHLTPSEGYVPPQDEILIRDTFRRLLKERVAAARAEVRGFSDLFRDLTSPERFYEWVYTPGYYQEGRIEEVVQSSVYRAQPMKEPEDREKFSEKVRRRASLTEDLIYEVGWGNSGEQAAIRQATGLDIPAESFVKMKTLRQLVFNPVHVRYSKDWGFVLTDETASDQMVDLWVSAIMDIGFSNTDLPLSLIAWKMAAIGPLRRQIDSQDAAVGHAVPLIEGRQFWPDEGIDPFHLDRSIELRFAKAVLARLKEKMGEASLPQAMIELNVDMMLTSSNYSTGPAVNFNAILDQKGGLQLYSRPANIERLVGDKWNYYYHPHENASVIRTGLVETQLIPEIDVAPPTAMFHGTLMGDLAHREKGVLVLRLPGRKKWGGFQALYGLPDEPSEQSLVREYVALVRYLAGEHGFPRGKSLIVSDPVPQWLKTHYQVSLPDSSKKLITIGEFLDLVADKVPARAEARRAASQPRAESPEGPEGAFYRAEVRSFSEVLAAFTQLQNHFETFPNAFSEQLLAAERYAIQAEKAFSIKGAIENARELLQKSMTELLEIHKGGGSLQTNLGLGKKISREEFQKKLYDQILRINTLSSELGSIKDYYDGYQSVQGDLEAEFKTKMSLKEALKIYIEVVRNYAVDSQTQRGKYQDEDILGVFRDVQKWTDLLKNKLTPVAGFLNPAQKSRLPAAQIREIIQEQGKMVYALHLVKTEIDSGTPEVLQDVRELWIQTKAESGAGPAERAEVRGGKEAKDIFQALKTYADQINREYRQSSYLSPETFRLNQEAVKLLEELFELNGRNAQTKREEIKKVEDLKAGDILLRITAPGEYLAYGPVALLVNPDLSRTDVLIVDSNGSMTRLPKSALIQRYPYRVLPRAEARKQLIADRPPSGVRSLLRGRELLPTLKADTRIAAGGTVIRSGQIGGIALSPVGPGIAPGFAGEFPPSPLLARLRRLVEVRPYAQGLEPGTVIRAITTVATRVSNSIGSEEDMEIAGAAWMEVFRVWAAQGVSFQDQLMKALLAEGALSEKTPAGALTAKARSRALTTPGASVMIFNRMLTTEELRALLISPILSPVLLEIVFAPGVVKTTEDTANFKRLQEEARRLVPGARVNLLDAESPAEFSEILAGTADRLHGKAVEILHARMALNQFKDHILVNAERAVWEDLALEKRVERGIPRARYDFRFKNPVEFGFSSFLSGALITDAYPDERKHKMRVGPGNYLVKREDFSASPYFDSITRAIRNLLAISSSA